MPWPSPLAIRATPAKLTNTPPQPTAVNFSCSQNRAASAVQMGTDAISMLAAPAVTRVSP
ncbi:MAG: hypothetical protein LAO56_17385 [Acidobacteriia bacterium]|nr:hypothetical protein [Terriglobia bacterium]